MCYQNFYHEFYISLQINYKKTAIVCITQGTWIVTLFYDKEKRIFE
ncbi:hypothetical protein CCPUN_03420 [Cardinium endosymbiont of Culicoides punctatus]|nr:hypothetical protein CCPUN_03420 [Cardinium endosymbiont of Culicoides punctatus]